LQLKSGAIDDNAKRPHLASMASTVHEAEKWRGQIVKDISRKVLLIQNRQAGRILLSLYCLLLSTPPLTSFSLRGNPESKTRQLNDEINKLLREKRHWERRIVELGGANHSRAGDPQLLDENGNELPGSRGYRYFGAARDLPGVRDLFSKAPANSADVRRSRGDMNKFVDSACVATSAPPTSHPQSFFTVFVQLLRFSRR
jgi:pre-mRNA-splicing factor ISY1